MGQGIYFKIAGWVDFDMVQFYNLNLTSISKWKRLLQKCDISCKLDDEIFLLCSCKYSKSWQFCTKAITLSNLKVLTCLDLSSSTGVDGCVFTALPELSKLTALDLSDTTVNDDGLKNIVTKAFQSHKLLYLLPF
jgi:hypothetical protein